LERDSLLSSVGYGGPYSWSLAFGAVLAIPDTGRESSVILEPVSGASC
jgi:hypothetical protein